MRLYNRKRFSTFFKKLLTNQKNCAILISVIITDLITGKPEGQGFQALKYLNLKNII